MICDIITFFNFGYWPNDLKSKSSKSIIATCDRCNKIRITSKAAYRNLCRRCSLLKCHEDDPTLAQRQGAISKKRYENPEVGQKQSELVTEQWKNSKIRKNHSEGQKKRWENQLERAKQSERMTEQWKNPITREKRITGILKYYTEMDDPKLDIVKHHIAYDFNRHDALTVKITRSFHGMIHNPKGIPKRRYSLID